MLKIGIVGLGAVSATHIKVIKGLSSLAALTAVCDCNAAKGEKVPGIHFYTELEEMLKNESLDCLHICLPHDLHVWAAQLAAENGVNVFLEKPAGLNWKEVRSLKANPLLEKVKLGVCLQNRYNPTTVKALELVRTHRFGRLKGIKVILTWDRRTNYYDKDLWRGLLSRAGGGVMLSQAIHVLDLMCLLGGQPEWVKGLIGNLYLEDIEVEDTACAHIQFQNGVNGIFYGTVTHCANSSVELEAVMENGILNIKDNRLILKQGKDETLVAEDDFEGGDKAYYGCSHYQAIRSYYEELLGMGGSHISLEDAKTVSILIDQIIQSAREERKVFWKEVEEL